MMLTTNLVDRFILKDVQPRWCLSRIYVLSGEKIVCSPVQLNQKSLNRKLMIQSLFQNLTSVALAVFIIQSAGALLPIALFLSGNII